MMIRFAIVTATFLSCLLFTGACTDDGQKDSNGNGRSMSAGGGEPESGRIGGCSADTIPLDMSVVPSCDETSSHVRISILSVERAPDGIYVAAAEGLASLLDSIGAGICGVPRLVVIREGPCWPRHRIDFRLESESEKSLARIREALAEGMLAGLRPSQDRPEGYGTFFVQACVGSSDRWTLWYPCDR
jgi:hypothetical protein